MRVFLLLALVAAATLAVLTPSVNADKGHVFAFGDVHGDVFAFLKCLKKAGVVNQQCTPTAEGCTWEVDNTVVIFTGDFTDRGPWSLSIMRIILKLQPLAFEKNSALVMTRGNHEQAWIHQDVPDFNAYDEACGEKFPCKLAEALKSENHVVTFVENLEKLPYGFKLDHNSEGTVYSLFAHTAPTNKMVEMAMPDGSTRLPSAQPEDLDHGDGKFLQPLFSGTWNIAPKQQPQQWDPLWDYCEMQKIKFDGEQMKPKRVVMAHSRHCGTIVGNQCWIDEKPIISYGLDVCMSRHFAYYQASSDNSVQGREPGGFLLGLEISCSDLKVETNNNPFVPHIVCQEQSDSQPNEYQEQSHPQLPASQEPHPQPPASQEPHPQLPANHNQKPVEYLGPALRDPHVSFIGLKLEKQFERARQSCYFTGAYPQDNLPWIIPKNHFERCQTSLEGMVKHIMNHLQCGPPAPPLVAGLCDKFQTQLKEIQEMTYSNQNGGAGANEPPAVDLLLPVTHQPQEDSGPTHPQRPNLRQRVAASVPHIRLPHIRLPHIRLPHIQRPRILGGKEKKPKQNENQ